MSASAATGSSEMISAIWVALTIQIELAAVQDGAVIPHDHVAFAPGMGEAELRLVGALAELVEQRLAGRPRPADDEAGMGADIERAPAVDRVVAIEALLDRRQLGDRLGA